MIHHEVAGAGPPLLLHTGAAGDLRMWREAGYVDGIGDYRAVLVDHRGHGCTPPSDDPAAYTPAAYAADALEVADALGLDRFAFWGYSNGARVGYELAASEPERVAALVVSGGIDGPDDDPEEWREAVALVREQGVEAILGEEPCPEWLRRHLVEATDRAVLVRELEGFVGWSPWPLLPRIAAPALIVAGEDEAQHVLAAADALPHGRAEILPGLGHLGAFARSDLVLPHVRRFLAEALA